MEIPPRPEKRRPRRPRSRRAHPLQNPRRPLASRSLRSCPGIFRFRKVRATNSAQVSPLHKGRVSQLHHRRAASRELRLTGGSAMIETGSHTVLVFVKLQFLQQWSRFNGAEGITYTVTGKAGELLVVTEDENAAKTTYW